MASATDLQSHSAVLAPSENHPEAGLDFHNAAMAVSSSPSRQVASGVALELTDEIAGVDEALSEHSRLEQSLQAHVASLDSL